MESNFITNIMKFLKLFYEFISYMAESKIITTLPDGTVKKDYLEFVNKLPENDIVELTPSQKIRDIVLNPEFQLTDDFISKYASFINNKYDTLSKIVLQHLAVKGFPFDLKAKKYVSGLLKKHTV
jgi:hypothetical protein